MMVKYLTIINEGKMTDNKWMRKNKWMIKMRKNKWMIKWETDDKKREI